MIYVMYGIMIFIFLLFVVHLVLFIKFRKHFVPVFMYHRITDDKKDDKVRYQLHKGNQLDLDSMKVSPTQFDKQMNYLFKKKYTVGRLTKDSLIKKSKHAYITFDDGYKDNFLFAYPTLKKYNQVGIFYVTADLIDQDKFMPIDINDKRNENKLLSWDEIIIMAQDNMQIGSHTMNHPWLTDSNVNQEEEIVLSKKLIEEKTKIKVDTFAYPGGLYNEESILLAKSNYETAVITSRGDDFPNSNKNEYLIERETISSNDSMFMFKFKLYGFHKFLRKLVWLKKLRGFVRWLLKR